MVAKELSYEQVASLLDENNGNQVFRNGGSEAIPHIITYIVCRNVIDDHVSVDRGFKLLSLFGKPSIVPLVKVLDEMKSTAGINPLPCQKHLIGRICDYLSNIGSKEPIPEAMPHLVAIAISRHPNSSDAKKAIMLIISRTVANINSILSKYTPDNFRRIGESGIIEADQVLRALAGGKTPLLDRINGMLANDTQRRRNLGEGLIGAETMRLERPLRQSINPGTETQRHGRKAFAGR